jgi:tetratricopeptide (TPR) repeat protein
MSPRRHRGLSSRLSNAGAASRATRVCVASLFAAAGLLVAIGAASAAPSTEAGKKAARPHYEKGASEYNLGHFAESISEFEKAYEQDPAPILLFNIAQAHRQSGNNERAAFFYRRYLEQEPNAANRAEVEKRIKDLEGVIQQQNDVKRRPPTEVTDQDQRAAATPPAATNASPSASNAFPPPPPQGTAASALPPPITPSSPAPEVSVNAGMTNVVPESAHPIKVWVSAGPAFPSFSGRDLQEPTLFSLRLGVAYAIDLHNAGFLDVGLSGAYAPFQYRTLDTDANRSAAFWGVLASAKYRYRLAPSFDIAGEVGGGVVWWSGLADQNPFTTDAVAATGAVPMPSLLLGVGAIYHLSTHVSLFAQPTFLLSKTTGDGLSSAISSVSRIDLAFGLGFSI